MSWWYGIHNIKMFLKQEVFFFFFCLSTTKVTNTIVIINSKWEEENSNVDISDKNSNKNT